MAYRQNIFQHPARVYNAGNLIENAFHCLNIMGIYFEKEGQLLFK